MEENANFWFRNVMHMRGSISVGASCFVWKFLNVLKELRVLDLETLATTAAFYKEVEQQNKNNKFFKSVFICILLVDKVLSLVFELYFSYTYCRIMADKKKSKAAH